MLRRLRFLLLILAFAKNSTALGQGFEEPRDVDRSYVPTPRPTVLTWPGAQQVKTGRITIEFQYVAPAESRGLLRLVMILDELWNLIAINTPVDSAAAMAWRQDLPVLGDLQPQPAGFAHVISLGNDTPASRPLGAADIVSSGFAETVITSVKIAPASGGPASLPLPDYIPSKLRLEFFRPPAPEPVKLDTDFLDRLIHGLDVDIRFEF